MNSVALLLLLAAAQAVAADVIEYAALYQKGLSMAAFTDAAGSRADEWRRRTADARVDDEVLRRVRALPGARRLLVVRSRPAAIRWLRFRTSPGSLRRHPIDSTWRIVNSRDGRVVMEAHRTPDGRAATPTVVVLDGEGRYVGAWSERPAALQAWYIEQKSSLSRGELSSQKAKWYAADGGKSALAEIMALVEK